MQTVNAGIVGLGTVGSGTLAILAENARQIETKLGFPLGVKAVCSRSVETKTLPAGLDGVLKTNDWRQVCSHPEVDIVVELIGGTNVAREVIECAIQHGKSVVTANKELMAICGADIWERAIHQGVNLGIEASVAGGIRSERAARRHLRGSHKSLVGILNGTSNYILTEIERHGESFEAVLAEAQELG